MLIREYLIFMRSYDRFQIVEALFSGCLDQKPFCLLRHQKHHRAALQKPGVKYNLCIWAQLSDRESHQLHPTTMVREIYPYRQCFLFSFSPKMIIKNYRFFKSIPALLLFQFFKMSLCFTYNLVKVRQVLNLVTHRAFPTPFVLW